MEYHKLTVLRESSRRSSNGSIVWVCRCACGSTTRVLKALVVKGHTKSCGCFRREFAVKHGLSQTPEYRILQHVMRRCNDPESEDWKHYGARGIRVCKRWSLPDGEGVRNFIADMGHRPKGLTLERTDVNGDYRRSNCVWATMIQQNNNKRNNHTLTFRGKTQTISQWARERGIKVTTLWNRISVGWSVSKALRT